VIDFRHFRPEKLFVGPELAAKLQREGLAVVGIEVKDDGTGTMTLAPAEPCPVEDEVLDELFDIVARETNHRETEGADMAACDHKFIDTLHCVRCGAELADVRTEYAEENLVVRSLSESERATMKVYLDYVQREPLPTTDAATRERLAEAAKRWPLIAALFGGWSCDPYAMNTWTAEP
jgi:hypothetical protein